MSQTVKVTNENFEKSVKQKLAVLDFWAEWCGPCRVMGPIIDELSDELKGKVFFGKVNVDENPDLSEQQKISAVPTMLFFSNGKIVDIVVGTISKAALKHKIEELL